MSFEEYDKINDGFWNHYKREVKMMCQYCGRMSSHKLVGLAIKSGKPLYLLYVCLVCKNYSTVENLEKFKINHYGGDVL